MLHMMTHYVFRNGDDEIHVQNMVGGMFGQHHIHDAASFKAWVAEIPGKQLSEMKLTCDCGQTDGTYIGWPTKDEV